ncbi:glucan biosynthesis protein [Fertoebacter nigrum]|uniref:Glucan biosynthesis protein n=1 Tax=Fertoeibacter niger TaxID=2656921 RepID=A0A8X8GS59_9RHOB|nr:glucan biosynthesis protein G [Fertoeibacter niger]NUB43323.1 glucan biosynthesis protein [Fertoeibacter niger]
MPPIYAGPARVSRRHLILTASSAAALLAGGAFGLPAAAQTAAAPEAAPQQFSFDLLTEEMRIAATQPHVTAEMPEGFLGELHYDDYRLINFRANQARWGDSDSQYRVHAFHMGWLFGEPVRLFEVTGGTVSEMLFTTDDFEYYNELAAKVPAHGQLPGVAGFKLNTPLNRPDLYDELVAFLGASYFRALGQGNAYGISARGLAINTASSMPEEFPRFSRFYLERPAAGVSTVVVHAALESPSVTGAYRFVITPGVDTVMEVTARLFFRADVAQLGVAPLTSMFLFAEKNRADFDDYRPNVHDSDGLRIRRSTGDIIWRPLNNPPHLAGSYFGEDSPMGFGLHQRDRDFGNYQDPESRYERRPSLEVEPLGNWGKGVVRLVEIPTEFEVNDNIVAFWVPEGVVRAGDAREFAYRLRWGDLVQDARAPLAYVFETRSGHGGVSGVEQVEETRKFVIDFKGGLLAALPAPDPDDTDPPVKAITNVQNGEIVVTTLQKLDGLDIWRLVLDVKAAEGATVELGAHLAGYGRKLSEIWLNQWINA